MAMSGLLTLTPTPKYYLVDFQPLVQAATLNTDPNSSWPVMAICLYGHGWLVQGWPSEPKQTD